MNDLLNIRLELFKRGEFDFITNHGGKVFEKQKEALNALCDTSTTEIVYGGGAGGSKSFTGWAWLTLSALAYPGTHYFVARETLKDVRLYGMQSFSEVADFLGMEKNDFNFQYQDSIIKFKNGSKIYMLECKRKPSDKDFHGLGSSLFTSGFIEEGGEVHFDAFDTLCSRVNRWKNKKYNLLGKIFVTCNPSKNWIYNDFYLKDKNNLLPENQKFLPALAKDNPYIPPEYIERLNRLKDPNKRARLYLGNWEYDSDPTALIDFQTILNMWTNTHIQPGGKMCIVADVARFGSDKAVIGVWEGLTLIDLVTFPKSSTVEIQNAINALRTQYNISASRCIIDADGVGGGVVDNIPGTVGFVNNGKPVDPGYQNLKTECGYLLAENAANIYIKCELSNEVTEIIQSELGQLKTYDSDKDNKLRLLPKNKIIDNIGHSPDYLDMFTMRMYFELNNSFSFSGGTYNR